MGLNSRAYYIVSLVCIVLVGNAWNFEYSIVRSLGLQSDITWITDVEDHTQAIIVSLTILFYKYNGKQQQ